ncbi:MAG: exo-alpha-sialidase [Verrucomicrobia bacterium]|nr:MAG: exo-alpha-sialidase [Verrucomicrobiota bacterium]
MTDEKLPEVDELDPLIPKIKTQQILVESKELSGKQYLGFPCLIRVSDSEILISFKRGTDHGSDGEADLELVRFDTVANRVIEQTTLAHQDRRIMQMGEWVRFSNGDIANYIDVQLTGIKKLSYRTGILGCRSRDGGTTFSGLIPLGVVDGVEYGYAFDHVTEDGTTYMLVMTFEYLAGQRGSVDVIKTEDHGSTWRFVKNLSLEFGDIRINESTFVRWGDKFLISTRGYDAVERLHVTDSDFNLIEQVNLTEVHPFIGKEIGRPRLFERDGHFYLMGRNCPVRADEQRVMQQALFRIDPADLTITSYVILDNHEEGLVIDGYYPVPYWQEDERGTLFNVIDYKSVVSRFPGPNIVRSEFHWDEVR